MDATDDGIDVERLKLSTVNDESQCKSVDATMRMKEVNKCVLYARHKIHYNQNECS